MSANVFDPTIKFLMVPVDERVYRISKSIDLAHARTGIITTDAHDTFFGFTPAARGALTDGVDALMHIAKTGSILLV